MDPLLLDLLVAYAISTSISCGVQNIYWCYKDLLKDLTAFIIVSIKSKQS